MPFAQESEPSIETNSSLLRQICSLPTSDMEKNLERKGMLMSHLASRLKEKSCKKLVRIDITQQNALLAILIWYLIGFKIFYLVTISR